MSADTEVTFENFAGDLCIPAFGLKIRFEETSLAAEAGRVCLEPSVAGPPVHVHRTQEELFMVVAGTLEVLVGRDWRVLTPGDAVRVPPNTPHTYRNGAAEACLFTYRLTPGGGFTAMMHDFARLSAAGKLPTLRSFRALIYLAMVFVRYGHEVRSTQPPMAVMRLLAWVGRCSGFRLEEKRPGASRGEAGLDPPSATESSQHDRQAS